MSTKITPPLSLISAVLSPHFPHLTPVSSLDTPQSLPKNTSDYPEIPLSLTSTSPPPPHSRSFHSGSLSNACNTGSPCRVVVSDPPKAKNTASGTLSCA
jgi:hypothetical protein